MKWWGRMSWSSFSECWVLSQLFHSPLSLLPRGCSVPLHFLPQGWYHLISEVIDISAGSLDSSLCFIHPSISQDVFCILVKSSGWQYKVLKYSFPNLEPVCCFMFGSNCCFLTCIQISQEAGKVVWYSLLFQNFPQFVVIHTVKSFGVVKNEVDVFSGTLLLFLWSNRCWQFDLWFLYLF